MNYIVLDTCSIMHILRGNPQGEMVKDYLNNLENVQLITSIVCLAEANCLALSNSWGSTKIDNLNNYFRKLVLIDIEQNNTDLIDSYVIMDAYSMGKATDPNGNKLKGSAKKMGKNDVWIAATANTLGAELITFDKRLEIWETFIKIKLF